MSTVLHVAELEAEVFANIIRDSRQTELRGLRVRRRVAFAYCMVDAIDLVVRELPVEEERAAEPFDDLHKDGVVLGVLHFYFLLVGFGVVVLGFGFLRGGADTEEHLRARGILYTPSVLEDVPHKSLELKGL